MSRLFASLFTLGLSLLAPLLFYASVEQYSLFKREPQPVEMTLADYLKNPSPARWLKLTQCWVDYPKATLYRGIIFRNKVSDLTVPVYPTFETKEPIAVFLSISMPNLDQVPREAQLETIEGLTREGMFYTGIDPKLSKVGKWRLADRCIQIDQDTAPSTTRAGGLFAGGLLLSFLAIRGWIELRKAVPMKDKEGDAMLDSAARALQLSKL